MAHRSAHRDDRGHLSSGACDAQHPRYCNEALSRISKGHRTINENITGMHDVLVSALQAHFVACPVTLQHSYLFSQTLSFILGLFNTGAEFLSFLAPPFNILYLLFQLSLFDRFVSACSTQVWRMGQEVVMDQFYATSLPHAVLSGAPLLHVAPLPVLTDIRSLFVVAHRYMLLLPLQGMVIYRYLAGWPCSSVGPVSTSGSDSGLFDLVGLVLQAAQQKNAKGYPVPGIAIRCSSFYWNELIFRGRPRERRSTPDLSEDIDCRCGLVR